MITLPERLFSVYFNNLKSPCRVDFNYCICEMSSKGGTMNICYIYQSYLYSLRDKISCFEGTRAYLKIPHRVKLRNSNKL